MRRLYYVAADLHRCGLVEQALKEEGIRNWNFHVLSRDEIGLYQHRVHAASTWHQLDIIHTGERRTLIGAAVALALGILAWLLQPLPWEVGGLAVALLTLAGGLFGAWQGAVAGLSRQNYKIARFCEDLDAGRHLVMVDVGDHNRARVREIMNVRFPSVEYRGGDSPWINPFAGDHSTVAGPAGR